MYIVTVEFVIRPEHAEEFRAAMIENACRSRADEPQCRQFDVTCDPNDPATIFLYEVYDDRAAFDAHCASKHFRAFNEASRDWVLKKTVHVYQRLDP